MVTYAQHFKGGATLIHALYTIDEVYADEKVDWDDAGTIASFIAWEAVLWGTDFLEWRKIHKKPLYIIEAAIIAGGVISYGIAGREGLMNYVDLMTGKVSPMEFAEKKSQVETGWDLLRRYGRWANPTPGLLPF